MPRLLVAAVIATLVVACATSPLGRRQLKLVSDEQMNEMGVASFQQLKEKTPVTKDAKQSGYVSCVARNVTAVMGGGNWEVQTFDDKAVNAFALPGGKIGVYTGLLKVAKTQDQLAAVIGHEVAHVIAGHSAERVSAGMAEQLGIGVVQSATGIDAETLGMASQIFLTLPYSRAHESEADLLGMDYMAKAGFNPAASIELWQNMRAASGGNKPPEMISTHPSDETRIAQLQQRLPTAQPLYEQARAQGRKPSC